MMMERIPENWVPPKPITMKAIVEEIGEDEFFYRMLEWKMGGHPEAIDGYDYDSWSDLYYKFQQHFNSWLLLKIWEKV